MGARRDPEFTRGEGAAIGWGAAQGDAARGAHPGWALPAWRANTTTEDPGDP